MERDSKKSDMNSNDLQAGFVYLLKRVLSRDNWIKIEGAFILVMNGLNQQH